MSTNFGASQAITVTGAGRITKMCVVFTVGTVTQAEVMQVLFFDADPAITIDTAVMTVAEAQTVVAQIQFTAAPYLQTTTAQVHCNGGLNEPFHSITHVVLYNEGATTLTDEDVEIHFWYERFE